MNTPSRGRDLAIPLLVTAIAVAIGFGLIARFRLSPSLDFSGMTPRSEGSSAERWSLVRVAMKGPFAWVGSRFSIADDWGCLATAMVLVAMTLIAFVFPRRRGFVVLALLAVGAWCFLGFARTMLRIT